MSLSEKSEGMTNARQKWHTPFETCNTLFSILRRYARAPRLTKKNWSFVCFPFSSIRGVAAIGLSDRTKRSPELPLPAVRAEKRGGSSHSLCVFLLT